MSLKLLKKNAGYFYVKNKIKMDRIVAHRLKRPIYGVLAFIAEEGRHSDYVKVGVRFVEKISQEILDSL